MNILTRLYVNAGTISKFVVAIVSDVVVNMHNGWTTPTGITTDVLAFLIWLVPNVSSVQASTVHLTDASTVPPGMQADPGQVVLDAIQKTR